MTKKYLFPGIIVSVVLLGSVISILQWRRSSTLGVRESAAYEPPIFVGTNVWPGYEPLYLARSLGYWDDSSVKLVEYSSASQVIRAFRNDAIQIAALTLDEVLLLKEQGHDLQVILVTDISDGADVILGKPDILTSSDLRGRSIGVESSALGAYVLTRSLEQLTIPLAPSDLKIVPLEVDEHERAFLEGRIDAVVTFEPVRSRLLAKGAIQLFDSSLIPGEVVDVLTNTTKVVNSNKTVNRYLYFSMIDEIGNRTRSGTIQKF